MAGMEADVLEQARSSSVQISVAEDNMKKLSQDFEDKERLLKEERDVSETELRQQVERLAGQITVAEENIRILAEQLEERTESLQDLCLVKKNEASLMINIILK